MTNFKPENELKKTLLKKQKTNPNPILPVPTDNDRKLLEKYGLEGLKYFHYFGVIDRLQNGDLQ